MKNGYDQFFKNARKAADQGYAAPRREIKTDLDDAIQELAIKRKLGFKSSKKKASFPFKLAFLSLIGFLGAGWGYTNYEKVESYLQKIEIHLLGEVSAAEEKKPVEAKKDTAKTESKESSNSAALASEPIEESYLVKLNDRKKELDSREEELNRMEAEIQQQKEELEKRIKDLDEMRRKISSVLEERVKGDTQKIDTLVQMYSNMKAPQAAKIFESMDEDLAVEILSRMKKKNAADIMNLLKAEKAQTFSEKFAGYKTK